MIILIMFSLIISTLCYRQAILKRKKKKAKKPPVIYVSTFSLGIGLTFCLRVIIKNSEMKNEILGYGLIILSFIFLLIACVNFQNFIICKRYGFEG